VIVLVTYDLRGQRDYASFYATLGQQGPWWHYVSSTWLLSTERSPEEVAESLRSHLDPNDSILVTEMARGARYAGILPEPAWQWIEEQNKVSEEQRKAQALRAMMRAARSAMQASPAKTDPDPQSFLGKLFSTRPDTDKK
jgi:hypothetical protein